MGNREVRQSNFELLRIISMAMIVGLHYFNGNMGGALSQLNYTDYNFYPTYFFESMFIVGVNCFILITGYFQIEKTSININKLVGLLIQTIFYGLLFYSIAVIVGVVPLSIIELAKAILPFISGLRWFIKVYIILLLLIPFLNIVLNKLNKKTFQVFLIIMIVFFSMWPSLLPGAPVTDNGYGIITFVLLYALGAYKKKYYIANHSKKFYFGGYFLCGFITFVCSIMASILLYGQWLDHIWGYNFIFNIFGSIFLFLLFSKLTMKLPRINYIATFSLGVYFVHSDPSINNILFKNILHTDDFWFSQFYTIHVFISITVVYVFSTFIDIIRKQIFDSLSKYTLPFFKKNLPILWKQIP